MGEVERVGEVERGVGERRALQALQPMLAPCRLPLAPLRHRHNTPPSEDPNSISRGMRRRVKARGCEKELVRRFLPREQERREREGKTLDLLLGPLQLLADLLGLRLRLFRALLQVPHLLSRPRAPPAPPSPPALVVVQQSNRNSLWTSRSRSVHVRGVLWEAPGWSRAAVAAKKLRRTSLSFSCRHKRGSAGAKEHRNCL